MESLLTIATTSNLVVQPGDLHSGVFTTRSLKTMGSYNQGSYNYGSYNQGS